MMPDLKEPGTHRRPFGGMTQAEIDDLVARVATRVMEDFYQEVGRSVVKRTLQVIGIAAVVIALWLIGTGKWKAFQ
jgi:hypothetical protein